MKLQFNQSQGKSTKGNKIKRESTTATTASWDIIQHWSVLQSLFDVSLALSLSSETDLPPTSSAGRHSPEVSFCLDAPLSNVYPPMQKTSPYPSHHLLPPLPPLGTRAGLHITSSSTSSSDFNPASCTYSSSSTSESNASSPSSRFHRPSISHPTTTSPFNIPHQVLFKQIN